MNTQLNWALRSGAVMAMTLSLILAGCGKKEGDISGGPEGTSSKKTVEIRVKGSDTMVQLATGWAEAYRKVKPNVFVNANGGGTGTGFAALQNNTCDICDASREIKSEEAEKTKSVTGKDVKEFVVAYDALAVYTHPSNPIKEISVEELREIWAEGGTITPRSLARLPSSAARTTPAPTTTSVSTSAARRTASNASFAVASVR
jgi:phosphate transport system substrate-binding protein